MHIYFLLIGSALISGYRKEEDFPDRRVRWSRREASHLASGFDSRLHKYASMFYSFQNSQHLVVVSVHFPTTQYQKRIYSLTPRLNIYVSSHL